MAKNDRLTTLLTEKKKVIVENWIKALRDSDVYREELVGRQEMTEQCHHLLDLIIEAAKADDFTDVKSEHWQSVRDELGTIARARAEDGLQPSEAAAFLLLLKRPIFHELAGQAKASAKTVMNDVLLVDEVLDTCVLWMSEPFQDRLRDVINRQQADLLELSTPVTELWDRVLALPLIGTLDSARTQVVMESLLEKIVETGADVAIIDITGVPTVDTMVAQHLLKAVTAARLMGAVCIISGIRPTIAQTMVQLGVDLKDVVTKGTLADAFAWALERQQLAVVPRAVAEEMNSSDGGHSS